jgi:hypothetical protein
LLLGGGFECGRAIWLLAGGPIDLFVVGCYFLKSDLADLAGQCRPGIEEDHARDHGCGVSVLKRVLLIEV